jgi:hypothetical protein
MVLTKEELISTLRNEVRILLHLAGKVDRAQLDYRPTSTQRSTLELMQYMAVMGPTQIAVIERGAIDGSTLRAVWGPADTRAKALDFDQALAEVQRQADYYRDHLGQWTEADFRTPIEVFGRKTTRGSILVTLVVSGHAAYRTQLFCYLKACGRDELNTMNLWGGADGPMPAAAADQARS